MTDILAIDQKLLQNQSIVSPNRKYFLIQQSDGNLVLYQTDTGKATWHTNTASGSGNFANLQADGNFVVYDSKGSPLWSAGSNRSNFKGVLIVTDKGKISIVDVVFDVTGVPAKG